MVRITFLPRAEYQEHNPVEYPTAFSIVKIRVGDTGCVRVLEASDEFGKLIEIALLQESDIAQCEVIDEHPEAPAPPAAA
jgi:hypothetical protein